MSPADISFTLNSDRPATTRGSDPSASSLTEDEEEDSFGTGVHTDSGLTSGESSDHEYTDGEEEDGEDFDDGWTQLSKPDVGPSDSASRPGGAASSSKKHQKRIADSHAHAHAHAPVPARRHSRRKASNTRLRPVPATVSVPHAPRHRQVSPPSVEEDYSAYEADLPIRSRPRGPIYAYTPGSGGSSHHYAAATAAPSAYLSQGAAYGSYGSRALPSGQQQLVPYGNVHGQYATYSPYQQQSHGGYLDQPQHAIPPQMQAPMPPHSGNPYAPHELIAAQAAAAGYYPYSPSPYQIPHATAPSPVYQFYTPAYTTPPPQPQPPPAPVATTPAPKEEAAAAPAPAPAPTPAPAPPAPPAKDEAYEELKKMIIDEREAREAREAAAKKAEEERIAAAEAAKQKADEIAAAAKAAAEAATTEAEKKAAAAAAEEAEKRKAEADAAAEKAKKDAEDAAAKAKEEQEAAVAAVTASLMPAAPEEKKKPIKFKDAVGRKFSFPFHLCATWQGMEELIRQAFLHVDIIGPHVVDGHYDLIGPNNEIILPAVWETVIEPDLTITMHMWPMPEPKVEEPPPVEVPEVPPVVEAPPGPAEPKKGKVIVSSRKKNKAKSGGGGGGGGGSSSTAAVVTAAIMDEVPPPPPPAPAPSPPAAAAGAGADVVVDVPVIAPKKKPKNPFFFGGPSRPKAKAIKVPKKPAG